MAEPHRDWLPRYGVALLAVIVATLLRWLLDPFVADRAIFLTFFLAIFASAVYGGWGPGVLSVVLSGVVVTLIFLRSNAPPHPRVYSHLGDSIGLALFLAAAGISLLLAHRMHQGRRRAEQTAEQMRLERERFQVTLASIADGVIVTDPLGEITFLNTVAEQLTGWTLAEVLGQPLERCFRILTSETRQPDRTPVTRVVREGAILGVTDFRLLINKHGHELPVEDSTAPIRDHAGRVVGIVVVFRDVTQRRQAQEELRQNQQRLELALDAGRMGTWEWNIPSGEVRWSPGLEALHGLSPGTFPGTFEAYQHDIHPEDRDFVLQSIRETLANGHDHRIEYRIVWPDGSVHWIEARGKLFRTAEGEPIRMIGVCMDATQRKRSEATLRFLADASASLAGLVDYKSTLQKVAQLAVPDFADWCAVDLLNEQGQLERLAAAHADPGKLELARALADPFPAAPEASYGARQVITTGQPALAEEISPALLDQWAQSAEHRQQLERLGLKSYLCVPLAAYGRVMGAMTFVGAGSGRRFDVHDQRVAEDLAHRAGIAIENARLYEQLRAADRRKDEFLAMLAHELRNPLAPIRTGLDLLALDPSVPRESVDLMQSQVQHLVRLVDDLLDVSRIMRDKVHLRKEPIQLSEILQRAVTTVQPYITERQQKLELRITDRDALLMADPVRLTQVFGNLLNNASKYTQRGGRIEVEATRCDDRIAIRVRDNGIGIEPHLLPRVFDLFTQAATSADRDPGGLGIGLTLVRRLVELHEGTVTAHSAGPHQGSEFLVTLPAHCGPLAESPAAPVEHKARPLKVLVVDDNTGAAKMLQLLLTRLGPYEVQVAHNGVATLEVVAKFSPDLILLDIGLPGMDGYEVARRLRQQAQGASAVLVAVTGYGQDSDRRRSLEAGFDRHLVKPVALDTLQQLLASV